MAKIESREVVQFTLTMNQHEEEALFRMCMMAELYWMLSEDTRREHQRVVRTSRAADLGHLTEAGWRQIEALISNIRREG